jgi:4-hydroxybenzoate polyprenyltransferase
LLKKISIIDVVCIAIGFVLRVFAGGIAADVALSQWIVIMTFLIALFLALSKRRDDLIYLEHGKPLRKSMMGYNRDFLTLSMGIIASVIIVSYILYTVSPDIAEKHNSRHLYLTAFWVVLGILRYLQIAFVKNQKGSPINIFFSDIFLQLIVVCWLLSFYLLLYGFNRSSNDLLIGY